MLLADYGLNEKEIPKQIIRRVRSVNNNDTINLLRDINPNAVVVNGTRIISKKVLSCIDAPFINTHLGITLKYRGVHGGYWALANGDPDNYGVTVHLIDVGIDTGEYYIKNSLKF